ncbi:MAG: CopG family transcriptional regulator [Deltaproteobacteria bacterium]|nr:CopG family transcriptional regulator [Deltaproteobacteria bacterium]
MARTTISLQDDILKKIKIIAKRDNRSTPNLIETILIQYINESFFVDEVEMHELEKDAPLKQEIKRALADYKKNRGRFV